MTGIIEELYKTVIGACGEPDLIRSVLPGGTQLPTDEQREKDRIFLDDLAELVVIGTTGRPRDDETFKALTAATRKLFHDTAQTWYDSGHGDASVGEGIREFLGLPQGAESNAGELLRAVLAFVTGSDAATYVSALIATWALDQETKKGLMSEDHPEDFEAALVAAGVFTPKALLEMAENAFKEVLELGKTAGGEVVANTSKQGNEVHNIIQMHYLATHEGPVLVGSYLVMTTQILNFRTWATLLKSPEVIAVWLRTALPGKRAGYYKQPDILDLRTQEVYEIKPFEDYAAAYRQLFGYLLMLNLPLLGVMQTTKLLNTLTGAVGTGSPPVHYLPGTTWTPAPSYALPDGRIAWVLRMGPGIIGYRVTTSNKLPQTVPVGAPATDLSRQQVGALVTVTFAVIVVLAIASPAGPAALAFLGANAELASGLLVMLKAAQTMP